MSTSSTTSVTPPRASLGLRIAAILCWCGCAVLLIVVMIAATVVLSHPAVPFPAPAFVLLALAAVYGLAGYGLGKRQRWGAWIALVVAGLLAPFQALAHTPRSLFGLAFHVALIVLIVGNWRRLAPAAVRDVGA